ncbi:RNA-binding KH domain-containing protein RCF3-like isoform X2 [Carex rostrata]
MASNLTPLKRPSDENPLEPEIPAKAQKTGPPAPVVKQRLVTYKVLCPLAQSGSVIGKGGNIVSRIRQETGAKIKLEDAMPGCNERIVIITSFYKEVQKVNEESERDELAENEEKEAEAAEPSEEVSAEKVLPAAFDALMRVFERVMLEECDIEADEEGGGEKRENKKEEEAERASLFVTFKMLVLSGQVGSLLGKGGVIIKKIMAESGAQVRVLSRDLLPLCAKPQEDVVQIAGELDSVRKAVVFIAKQLLERPPSRDRDRDWDPSKPAPTPSASSRHFAPKQFGGHSKFGGYPHEPVAPGPPVEHMAFRMLCTNDQVGSVIGKAGYIVKNIKNETDSDIMVSELVSEAESEDRLITIKGPVFHGDSFSPVQHAVLRVQQRLVTSGGAGAEGKEQRCRLVIASSQVGCLLGKGGSIMSEMRKQSNAFIRILARDKDPIPDGLEQEEEVIQINGNVESVQEAIAQITSRLKHHFLRDRAPPPFGMEPPFGPYMGRGGASPHQHFSSQPPPFHGYGRPYEEGPPYDRHAPWAPPPVMREPLPDYASDPPRRARKFSPYV